MGSQYVFLSMIKEYAFIRVAVDQTGARLSKFELTKRAIISSSKEQQVDIVPAPGWKELRG